MRSPSEARLRDAVNRRCPQLQHPASWVANAARWEEEELQDMSSLGQWCTGSGGCQLVFVADCTPRYRTPACLLLSVAAIMGKLIFELRKHNKAATSHAKDPSSTSPQSLPASGPRSDYPSATVACLCAVAEVTNVVR